MARERPVCQRASFSAASSASAPLLVKKTRLGDGPGTALGQPLRQVDLRLIVEIGAGHVQQLGRLILDGGDDLRDGSGRSTVTAMPAVKSRKRLPSTSSNDGAAAALDDQRIDARVRRRHVDADRARAVPAPSARAGPCGCAGTACYRIATCAILLQAESPESHGYHE